MLYTTKFIDQLKEETNVRFQRLMDAVTGRIISVRGVPCYEIEPSKIRLAASDFQTVLAELKRMK